MRKSDETNFYQLLQIETKASPTIIRYAYRFFAAMYHPDNEDTGNAELFRKVTEAFRVLIDKEKRAKYDESIGLKDDSTET